MRRWLEIVCYPPLGLNRLLGGFSGVIDMETIVENVNVYDHRCNGCQNSNRAVMIAFNAKDGPIHDVFLTVEQAKKVKQYLDLAILATVGVQFDLASGSVRMLNGDVITLEPFDHSLFARETWPVTSDRVADAARQLCVPEFGMEPIGNSTIVTVKHEHLENLRAACVVDVV